MEITDLANMAAALEITGAGRDLSGLADADYGPNMVLQRRFEDGTETWEILPRFIAEQTVTHIPDHEPRVRSARLHDRVPDHAPANIHNEWARRIMMALCKFAPLLVAA